MNVRLPILVLSVLCLCGCAKGAWQPVLAPEAGTELALEAERFEDGCSVVWSSLLVGLRSGALLDAEGEVLAALPGDQVFDLQGSAGSAIAQVHLEISKQPSTLALVMAPPASVGEWVAEEDCDPGMSCTAWEAGNAAVSQREELSDLGAGGLARGVLSCPDSGELEFTFNLPAASLSCSIRNWELAAGGSWPTWIEIDFHGLFSASNPTEPEVPELIGAHWFGLDSDGDAFIGPAEFGGVDASAAGLPFDGSIGAWLESLGRLLVQTDGGVPCTSLAWDEA